MRNKRILVAALNWGLGHATRCIPIIRELENYNFEPVIASDGPALEILKKEFPHLTSVELPSYNIQYSRKASGLKWKLMMNSPNILRTIQKEFDLTRELVKKYQIHGIISDNRWGVRSEALKTNVFITHQLNVLSGATTFLSSYIQRRYIGKFEECWVPDVAGNHNLSGILGHPNKIPGNAKYIGNLSRLEKTNSEIFYEYLVLLSGPEPQRSILESILLAELKTTRYQVLFIRGVISDKKLNNENANVRIENYRYGKSLEEAINSSRYIISRSGYTSLMDLSKLDKKAFLLPTPGQPEQEYLAKRMENLNAAPYCTQDQFSISKLEELENYTGLGDLGNHTFPGDCFALFQGE